MEKHKPFPCGRLRITLECWRISDSYDSCVQLIWLQRKVITRHSSLTRQWCIAHSVPGSPCTMDSSSIGVRRRLGQMQPMQHSSRNLSSHMHTHASSIRHNHVSDLDLWPFDPRVINTCRGPAIEYMCISSLVLQSFYFQSADTHRRTKSQMPLIAVLTHRLPSASVKRSTFTWRL